MFCINCGAPISDEAAFCTACGAAQPDVQHAGSSGVSNSGAPSTPSAVPAGFTVPASEVPQSGFTPSVQQPGAIPSQQPAMAQGQPAPAAQKKSNKGLIIGLVLAALAIVAIVSGVAIAGDRPPETKETVLEPVESQEPDEPEDGAEGEGQEAVPEEPEEVTPEEPAQPAASTIIDLSDPSQYQQINLFLSNFSEIYMEENSFTTSTASDETLVNFAVWHTYRNSPDLVESGGGENGYYDSMINGSTYWYNVRVSGDRVNEVCQRYLGRTPNLDSISTMGGRYYYRDGYVHFETTNGAGLPEGVTLAKSATDLGDGTVRVDFDIYGGNGEFYDATDTSLYGMTPEGIMATIGTDHPSRTGSAIVHYGEYNDYTGGLLLDSWEAH